MHAYLITSPQEKFHQLVTEILGYPLSSPSADLVILESDSSIGIGDIRQLQKFIAFPPNQSPKKAILIPEAEKMTTEAQNALLKTLEEPPEYVTLFLHTQNKSSLLTTVISRCQEIYSAPIANHPPTASIWPELEGKSLVELWRIAAQQGKNKQQALEWINSLIHELRARLHQQPSVILTAQLKAAQQALAQLNANVPPLLVLEGLMKKFV